MNKTLDHYPSRGGREACLEARVDPVVYAPESVELLSRLSHEQVAQYERDGFLVLPDVFSAEEVQCFKDELDRLRHDESLRERDEVVVEPGSGDVRSIFCVHSISPVFRQLASDERLAGIARGMLDDDVYIHQSRVNYKPGFRGKEFYWHSDFETWHVEDGMPLMRALSMSIALTENTPYNGSLMLIPGSHKEYVACTGKTPENHYKASLKKQDHGVPQDDFLAKMTERGGIVGAVAKPGSVIVFDCNVMHGSNGNITPDPRSNVFFVYNAVSNQLAEPFCEQPPRPEYLGTRLHVESIIPQKLAADNYCNSSR